MAPDGSPAPATGERPYRRRVLRGTVATIVANGWAMVIGLLTVPLFLGGLGVEAFGTWVLLQTLSVTTGWLSVGDLGLSAGTVRRLAGARAAGRHGEAARVAGTALVLFSLLGLAWAAVVGLVGPAVLPTLFRTPDDLEAALVTALGWFALQVVLDFVLQGLLSVLEGDQEVERSRTLEIARRTLVTGGAAVVAASGAGLAATAAASFVGTAVATLLAVTVMARSGPGRIGRPQAALVPQLARQSGPVALLRPLGVLHRTMDRFVVGLALGPGAVTVVEVAAQLQAGTAAVLGASSYAVIPSAAWLDGRGDRARLRELVVTGTRYTLLATYPVAALTAVLAGPAITLWVGSDLAAATLPTVLAVAYLVVVAPLQVGSNLLVGTGQARLVVRAAAAGLVINLGLSLALVGPLGVEGVFLATLVSAVVLTPVLGRAVLQAVHLGAAELWRASVRPPLIAAGTAAAVASLAVLAPLPDLATLAVGALAGTATYFWTATRVAMAPGEATSLLAEARGRTTPTPA